MPADITSQQQQERSSSQEGSSGRRKRESRAGTRSVSMLSPAQLERKRANDREAQRTIRQRTREHIESLERQVTELSEHKEQLDEALQQNAAFEAEIEHLKQQLAAVTQQLHYTRSHSLESTTDAIPCPSRSPIHHEMMVGQRQYPSMSQHHVAISSAGQVPSSVGMPLSASWDPYMLAPGSSNSGEFSTGGFNQNMHQNQVMQQQSARGPSSSAILYHHQMQSQQPHHPRSR